MADKKTLLYSFELDMVSNADDFAGQSGSYSIVRMDVWTHESFSFESACVLFCPQALIVGDFALENPFSWDIVSCCLLAMLDEEG